MMRAELHCDACVTCMGPCGKSWCREENTSPGEIHGLCPWCWETERDDAAIAHLQLLRDYAAANPRQGDPDVYSGPEREIPYATPADERALDNGPRYHYPEA